MATPYPKPVQDLIDAFAKFPGIGPRQAARFVFFLLHDTQSLIPRMKKTLGDLEKEVIFCGECYRVTDANKNAPLCAFCSDPKRDHATIAVVEKESDMQNIEKTGAFAGRYHILGGVISALDPDSPKRIHLRELHARISKALSAAEQAEIILATSATTEGDMTAMYIERILAPLKDQHSKLRVTRLGRGLSAGSELEYADDQTLRNALNNRK